MKKLLLISILSLIIISGYSQNPASHGLRANDPHITQSPEVGYFWGLATRDTVVASSTLSFYFTMPTMGFVQCSFYPYIHKTSGTVTNKIYFYGSGWSYSSPVGYNWEKRDSIVVTNASTGFLVTKVISNWKDPYMKVEISAGAVTQLAWYAVAYSFLY
jgi:hypothetical protein